MTTRPGSGYAGWHRRIQRERGRASDHFCVCGRRADQWAYHGVRVPGDLLPFSTNPDDYRPMCASCHVRFDQVARLVTTDQLTLMET